jgi:hypothetical protein
LLTGASSAYRERWGGKYKLSNYKVN